MTDLEIHNAFMLRCIELARKGRGSVAPNPMVAALLVHSGQIVAEGYHECYGGPHAEVNAINSMPQKELLPECTLYVNLEPCCHHGKTPPCAELIVKSQIPEVIVGCGDPNPLVQGGGIAILKAAGIRVLTGVLQLECEALNKEFFESFYKR